VRAPAARTHSAVDSLLREVADEPVADRVVAGGPAERRREGDLTAEAGDGNGGIGGAAAADGDELARLHLGVGQRELADAEHLVEDRDPGAQDARHVRPGSGRLRPMRG